MIRTHVFRSYVPKPLAESLNRESGRIYSQTMVEHYRIYRQTGHWLSPSASEKLMDFYDRQNGMSPLLHSHSVDAAQQGFPKACKTAKACRGIGLANRYPHKRKFYRTTSWKNTGITKKGGNLSLALARGLKPIIVGLPKNLASLPAESFCEMRLVYNYRHHFYQWHVVVDDGIEAKTSTGHNVIALDMGEIHPAVATDGETAVIFSARELRAASQYTNKRLASLQTVLSKKKKGSRMWNRLTAVKRKFLAKQKRRKNDIEQKVSRAVVNYAVERECKEIAIGDVRNIADGGEKGAVANQKISNWTHGQLRKMIEYKAEAEGISVVLVKEHYTTQTCPNPTCMHRTKPKGRVYRCPKCGFIGHRDVVGAANILSRHLFGDLAQVPVKEPKYRFAYRKQRRKERRPSDTRHMACAVPSAQEAAGL